ncbi:DgyrCDS14475 [Dimorphilus gyrociliatus]|uniref:DgyrCDS14475 n=1 Tax=Dimorphilus gyrociliatus TaxID=2664684 RepID=A0A7I8WDQ6_9ANNE|nr:DgyrCDS14475 [Dimorphilus gyrociliatus]
MSVLFNNHLYEMLKDQDKLTKTICTLLNSKTMTEISKRLTEIVGMKALPEEMAYYIRREYKHLKPYVEDGKFLEALEVLNELLKFTRENIINENVSTKSEFIEKYSKLMRHMSLKYDSNWWNNRYTMNIIRIFIRTLQFWRTEDASKGAIAVVRAKYVNDTDKYTGESLENLFVYTYNLVANISDDKINKVIQSYKRGYQLVEFVYLTGIFTLPACTYDKIADQLITFVSNNLEIITKQFAPFAYPFFRGKLSNAADFKIQFCNIINSKDKRELNNKLAIYLEVSRSYIEYYEESIIPFLHPYNSLSKSIEISEKLLSFIGHTKIILEWPINIPLSKIQSFLDDLLDTYGENWLRYIDPVFQFGISDFKMTRLMNKKLANSFKGVENDETFLINLGFSNKLGLKYMLKNIREFMLDAEEMVNLKIGIKLAKELLVTYHDFEKIGLIDLIKTPSKNCDYSKHKIIKDVVKFWQKNRYMIYTIIPILEKYTNTSLSLFYEPDIVLEFVCNILESSESELLFNFFGFIGTSDYYYYGSLTSRIIEFSQRNYINDNILKTTINLWIEILDGYKQFHRMRDSGDDPKDVEKFVENRLKNITEAFGQDWTMKLVPNESYKYNFHYSFMNYYDFKLVTKAIVHSYSLDEFNEKMNFLYERAETSKMMLGVIQSLVNTDWREIIPLVHEIRNLLIQFGQTNSVHNLMKLLYKY